MSSLTYRGRIELGVAAVVIAIGAFFVALAFGIRPGRFDPIGARALPLFLAFAIIALGLAIAVLGFGDRTPDGALPEGYGFRDSNLVQVVQVLGAGLVYFALFFAVGYLVATFIAFVCILYAFGVRNALTMLALALVTALIYQFVFVGLMGLNDPAGALVDLRFLSDPITGD